MRQHSRHFQCLAWLTLASAAIVVLDDRPPNRMELPALMQFSGSSTRAYPTGDAITLSGAAAASLAIDLVPLAGFPLSTTERDSIVRLALSLIGAPYHLGGASPRDGFDCSGLVRYVLAHMHVRLPRMAYQQARVGDEIERMHLQPGDLLTFGRDSISHIGIYIGAGKFIHASSVAGRVIVSQLDRPAVDRIRPLRGARRLLVMAAGPAAASGG